MEAGVKYLQGSVIMEMQVIIYKSKRNKVHVTIKAKGLGQRFEERRRRRPEDVFNIIQERPNTTTTVVHLKVDEAMEGRRSHKEMRSSR